MSVRLFLVCIVLLQTTLFASYNANIIDAKTLKPINGAMISDASITIKSDENGSFKVDANSTFHIKAYGYRRFSFDSNSTNKEIKLEPITVKALYLTFWGANLNSKTIKKVLNIVDKTKVNALVIDIKNAHGLTSFKTGFQQANKYGASKQKTINNIQKFMKLMKEKNIYTIARIVVFKDELQASHNPDYAIKKLNGKIWRNGDKMAWVNPYDKRSHEYTIAIAEEAAKVGFDEINFDYIRFPAKRGLKFSKKNTQKNRTEAISSFLDLAQNRLKKYGTFISVDTYGNVCWEKGDVGIGQTITSLAKHADYICPMLYPSGFSKGSFNVKHPSEHPYIVIYRSLKHNEKVINLKRMRPWLQSFRDYAHKRRYYKKFEITQQIKATEDVNSSGWMMWAPSSKYNINYFK